MKWRVNEADEWKKTRSWNGKLARVHSQIYSDYFNLTNQFFIENSEVTNVIFYYFTCTSYIFQEKTAHSCFGIVKPHSVMAIVNDLLMDSWELTKDENFTETSVIKTHEIVSLSPLQVSNVLETWKNFVIQCTEKRVTSLFSESCGWKAQTCYVGTSWRRVCMRVLLKALECTRFKRNKLKK